MLDIACGSGTAEMLRVCRPGGNIGLAGPIPEGWSGDFFSAHGIYVPPPPGVNPPLLWGTEDGLNELLGRESRTIKNKKNDRSAYYLSTEHAVEVFRTWFGPSLRALEILEKEKQQNLLDNLKEVFNRYNRADDGTAVVENT
ncbi:MAG: hypothetical protein ACNA8K_10330 [Cyclonatronaceae bacterium]